MRLEVVERDAERFGFNVTRCRYAEMYHALGIPELGAPLSCNRDYALIEGFNPEVELTRTQTLRQGMTAGQALRPGHPLRRVFGPIPLDPHLLLLVEAAHGRVVLLHGRQLMPGAVALAVQYGRRHVGQEGRDGKIAPRRRS